MVDFVRGMGRTISTSVTRPADTTAYAAGDVLCNSTSAPTILMFPRSTAEPGGASIIQQAICVDGANVATKPDLELWLFDTAITMNNDNAPFTPTDVDLRTLVGVIAFSTNTFKAGDATSGAGGNAVCDLQNIGMPVNTKGGDSALYGILVVRNAYVPVASERFDIRLKILD